MLLLLFFGGFLSVFPCFWPFFVCFFFSCLVHGLQLGFGCLSVSLFCLLLFVFAAGMVNLKIASPGSTTKLHVQSRNGGGHVCITKHMTSLCVCFTASLASLWFCNFASCFSPGNCCGTSQTTNILQKNNAFFGSKQTQRGTHVLRRVATATRPRHLDQAGHNNTHTEGETPKRRTNIQVIFNYPYMVYKNK